MADQWVMDTSAFTHWHRAGHGEILRRVAPRGGVVLIPDSVNVEIEKARETHQKIPAVADCDCGSSSKRSTLLGTLTAPGPSG